MATILFWPEGPPPKPGELDHETMPAAEIRAVAEAGQLLLDLGRQRVAVTAGGYAGLARALDVPADYLATLSATLAAQNLNHALKRSAAKVRLELADFDGDEAVVGVSVVGE